MLSSEYSVTEARVSETHHLRYYIVQDGSSENQVNDMNGSEGQMMGQQLQMAVPPVDFHLGLIRKKIAEIERIQLERIVIGVEYCYHVVIDANEYSVERFEECFGERLKWILCDDPFNSAVELLSKCNSNRRQRQITKKSAFESKNWRNIFEIGPRRTFTTAFSTNAVAVCQAAGIDGVRRLERSVRYEIGIIGGGDQEVLLSDREQILAMLHDRMTECEYEHDAEMCFERFDVPERYFEVDLMSAAENLRAANEQLGLAFDEADLDYYYDLFVNKLKRNPTDVELFDLAQSNSEHSRHTFFKGELIVDGVKRDKTLFDSLRETQIYSNANNIIAFSDNSSAIEGFDVFNLLSLSPCSVSEIAAIQSKRHIIYSAETHNFPTGVCPFPGAATGTGGRIRDIHATGRGAHEIAGVVGYAFGNMHLDGYALPWEEEHFKYDRKFAHPRDIIIQASNGASDYGNKFGEPVICGFSRSFGQRIADERWEYVKPILFSGGIGSIDEAQIKKRRPELGTLVAKIGGPAYRIGLGGGAASSVKIQGDDERRDSELDFGAVQRGDPEMEQKLHRVIRACVEYAENNPILSIHDQGAGGNGNVLKEIVDDEECGGAVLHACNFPRGDQTLSIRELWGAEYQENDAILLDASNVNLIQRIAKREKCSVSVVGEVTGDRKVVLLDYDSSNTDSAPVNLDLGVLGQRAPKVFHLKTIPRTSVQLKVPSTLSTQDALALVLRLPSVASKRFLTNKVDRSVTGLIAQQQCVGPLQTPLADVGVVALSYWNNLGGAVAVGEQPVKGMLSAEAGARMSLAEALTNLVFAPITHRKVSFE
ncbi:unnamed protein product [Anisakis simplex]|uniref:Probable phosphoribosylformylglycinamidine synthase (inferred by orthology to a C. elegans protein) n=1 Tax=Anisakis simplex TaxID=6269 RepID=A0A0M3K0U8_ANISI|nr:unnamed protein product [Anisakis simplex]